MLLKFCLELACDLEHLFLVDLKTQRFSILRRHNMFYMGERFDQMFLQVIGILQTSMNQHHTSWVHLLNEICGLFTIGVG